MTGLADIARETALVRERPSLPFSHAAAKEWATKGINVNVIAPGDMRTDLTETLWEVERGQKLLSGFPRRRIMSLNALDPMLLYLRSDASADVTGSV